MATGVLCSVPPPLFFSGCCCLLDILSSRAFRFSFLSFFLFSFLFFYTRIYILFISMYSQNNNKRKRQCLPSISQLLPSPPLSSHTFYSYYKPEYIHPPPTFFFDLTDSIINDTQVLEDASFFFFGQIRTPSPSASTTHKRKRDFILVDSYHHEASTKEKLIPDLIQSRK